MHKFVDYYGNIVIIKKITENVRTAETKPIKRETRRCLFSARNYRSYVATAASHVGKALVPQHGGLATFAAT